MTLKQIAQELVIVANSCDEANLREEANILTKIAEDIMLGKVGEEERVTRNAPIAPQPQQTNFIPDSSQELAGAGIQ